MATEAAKAPAPAPAGSASTSAAASDAACDAPLARKIELLRLADANGPVPQVALRKFRFLLLVTLGVGATSAALYPFLEGITIERGIFDAAGTSTNADARVELFQSAGGFLWAAVGLLLEEYYRIFMAAMLVYFANQAWYPGEVVTNGPGKFKRRVLFWFTPLAMYVVNVGISSIFVEHRLDKVVRAFTDGDLVSAGVLSATTMSAGTNGSNVSNSVVDTVLRRLVTKGAEPFRINATSTCASVVTNSSSKALKVTQNDSVVLPSMLDLQSTFVSFGFPARPWNLAALPSSLTPTHTVTVSRVNHNSTNRGEMQAKLDTFLAATGVTYSTIGELLIQGQTLHGKATTDSNMFETYRCDPDVGAIIEDEEEGDGSGSGSVSNASGAFRSRARRRAIARRRDRNRRLQRRNGRRKSGEEAEEGSGEEEEEMSDDEEVEDEDDGQNKVLDEDARVIDGMTVDKDGNPLCYGADNYLEDVVDFRNKSFQNVESVFESIYGFGGINFTKIQVTLDTFSLSPQLNLTTVTIDLPFDDTAEYVWVDPERCFVENATFVDPDFERENLEAGVDFEKFQEYMCSARLIANDGPYQTCGERNCVVEDYSNVLFMTKQVLLTPYFQNCSIGPHNVTYDKDISSWFPSNCSAQRDAAFVYGVGSYFEGDFQVRGGNEGPIITNPVRHYVLTFAKLEWRFEDLSARFGASCHEKAGGCLGLLHPLENVGPDANGSRVLIAGESALPKGFKRRTLRNPLPLVTLREPKLYENGGKFTYFMYEYVDLARMNTTHKESDGLGLAQGQCSVYIDAYLSHVEKNHYYIQDPRQPLYSAALYYLFQDAQVKQVTLPKNLTGGALDLRQRVLGSTRLTGDVETKEIRYSVPLVSVISTCTGMLILIVYMAIILKFPRDAVKLSDQTNPAAQLADVLVEEYPERVHTRRLRLADGSLVEMDDYDVQRIEFRNIHKPDEPVVMEG